MFLGNVLRTGLPIGLLTKASMSAVPCGIASFICHWFLHDKHFEGYGSSDAGITIYSGFTFALGFLIVFRMNQAYSRWWEAGTLLQDARSQWFNAYSSLIAMSNTAPEKARQVVWFHHMLARLMSLLYGTSILQLCTMRNPSLQTIHVEGMDEKHLKFLEECHDKVEVVLQWVQKAVVTAENDGTIQAAPPIISRIYSQLGGGMGCVASARKVIEFPIPSPIVRMIPFMLCAQLFATVVISCMLVKDSAWAAVLSFLNTFCLWSINYLAAELEVPYGDEPDDLPLYYLQADMNASLAGILHPLALRTPSFDLPINAEGNVALKSGIVSLKQNGTLDFREAVTGDEECLNFSIDPDSDTPGGTNESHQHFHVPRSVIGKNDRFTRGPSLEAAKRRTKETRHLSWKSIHRKRSAHPDGAAVATVTNLEHEPPSQSQEAAAATGVSDPGRTAQTEQESSGAFQAPLESTISAHYGDIEAASRFCVLPVERQGTPPQMGNESLYDI